MDSRRTLTLTGAIMLLLAATATGKVVYEVTKPRALGPTLVLDAGPDLAAADDEGYLSAATFASDHRSVFVSLRALPGALVVFDAFLNIANPTDEDRATLLDITLVGTPGSGAYAATLRDGQGASLSSVGPAGSDGGGGASRYVVIPPHDARALGFTYRALATAPGSGALLNADVRLRN